MHAYSAISFTIVATLRAPIEMQLGVPQTGMVQLEEIKYYVLTVAPSAVELTITSQNYQGASSMFVSNTEQPKPSNASTYQWSAPYYQPSKSIKISLANPNLRLIDGMIELYIGVQGMTFTGTQLSNYTLNAFTSASTVSLQSGVPLTRSLDQGTYIISCYSQRALRVFL